MFTNSVFGQIRCGTVEYEKLINKVHPKHDQTIEFEQWIQTIIDRKKVTGLSRENAELIDIPIVIHIIHNGENIGVGRNLSEAQILSQIDVLNQDFRRLNADASNTPTIFQPVAADIEIEFSLAQRDPEGLPTTGINRIDGGRPSWLLADNVILKSLIQWPPEDYLNIWVAEIDQEFLGYAQFPTSNTLGGLGTASSNESTDGIVIHYRAFGTIDGFPQADLFSQYQFGRTATHEIGHYLGLRHIWGDNTSCSIDDFVTDTPPATGSNNGLGSPCNFPEDNTCNNDTPDQPDMFQNYMDFSDDICMNLFTLGQKDRIRTVLDNSPRRVSLANSKGAQAPEIVSNDLGIRNIIAPSSTSCDATVVPELEMRNYGNNQVTSFSVETRLNGVLTNTDDFSIDINLLDLQNITLSAVSLNESINNEISFRITSTNGTTDGNIDNNDASISVEVPESGSVPFTENFDTFPEGWTINNIDEVFGWQIRNAPKESPSNIALGINLFDYEIEGELDLFQSPLLDLTNASDAILTFDVSYAAFPGVDREGLFITVTDMCEDPVFESDTVFFKLGQELATTTSTSFFVPSDQQQWRQEVVDLRAYLDRDNIRISFISQNAFGNNLYIDNLMLDITERLDISLENVVSPAIVSCQPDQQLIIELRNSGTVPIGSFEIEYNLNGSGPQTETITLEDSLELNQTFFAELSTGEFSEGENSLEVSVSNPNGTVDINSENNDIFLNLRIDDTQDIVPLKETFDNAGDITWSFTNPDDDIGWELTNTNNGLSATVDLVRYEQLGEEDWLSSPVLDLTGITQATLNFDVAYSFRNERNDRLSVLISVDCGSTYFVSDFQRAGSNLKTADFSGLPNANSVWQNNSISLNDFIGSEEVRIAFVSTNSNGNNIFLDNIQVFTTDFVIDANMNLFPNPTVNGAFNVRFDLDERETVEVTLLDVRGNRLLERVIPNTINQTFNVDMSTHPQGIYLIRVQGETFSYVERVFHGR